MPLHVAAVDHLVDDLGHALVGDPQPSRQLSLAQRLVGQDPKHVTVGAAQIVEPACLQVGAQQVAEGLVAEAEQDPQIDGLVL